MGDDALDAKEEKGAKPNEKNVEVKDVKPEKHKEDDDGKKDKTKNLNNDNANDHKIDSKNVTKGANNIIKDELLLSVIDEIIHEKEEAPEDAKIKEIKKSSSDKKKKNDKANDAGVEEPSK